MFVYNFNRSLVQVSKKIDRILGNKSNTTNLGKKYFRDLKAKPGYQINLVSGDVGAHANAENIPVSIDAGANANAENIPESSDAGAHANADNNPGPSDAATNANADNNPGPSDFHFYITNKVGICATRSYNEKSV